MKKIILTVAILTFAGLAGCSTGSKILNPYDDEFVCPYTDEGMCTSMKKAYELSFEQEEDTEVCPDGNCDKAFREKTMNNENYKKVNSAKEVYQEKKYQMLAGLIQEEEPPIIIPPAVVRVLILSYTGDRNDMFGFRYAYFFGSKPEWVLPTAYDRRGE